MNFTRKFDRAFQWAGEKMGAEAKTTMTDDFKMLETEMALRYDGMERLQKSMIAYVKWLGRRGETFEDKEKGLPASYLGRTMISHGEDFEPDSEFGNCLIGMGRANEKIAAIQETYVADATTLWLESLERSLAMMREYQAARKKLENRRLAYDASITKMQKAKRDDFRIEEELRTAKAKYEESSEDVARRMQDIKDAEADSMHDLTAFLDAELDYHERCADELRRTRQNWAGAGVSSLGSMNGYGSVERRPAAPRSRSNTGHSYSERLSRTVSGVSNVSNHSLVEEPEPLDHHQGSRMPIRSNSAARLEVPQSADSVPEMPRRPSIGRSHPSQSGGSISRANTFHSSPASASSYGVNQAVPQIGSLRGQLRPVNGRAANQDNVFSDHDDDRTTAGSGSPGERSTSPATSFGSLSRSTSNVATIPAAKKGPPPPPPSRSKKPPPPPIPAKREVGY